MKTVLKDLSRFGRDYVMSGYYTEIIFAQYDVEFISVTDNVNSKEGLGMDFLPFHNLMNDWYAKAISKKQKAVIQNKGNSGKRLNPNPIYGYKKDEQNQWIIDETALKTSEQFNYLFAHKILSPRACRKDIRKGSFAEKEPCLWTTATVSEILDHQEYCGDTVNFRTEKSLTRAKNYSPKRE